LVIPIFLKLEVWTENCIADNYNLYSIPLMIDLQLAHNGDSRSVAATEAKGMSGVLENVWKQIKCGTITPLSKRCEKSSSCKT